MPPQCTQHKFLDDAKRLYEYVKKGDTFCDYANGILDSIPISSDWVGPGWYRVTGEAGTQLSTHVYEFVWGSSNDGTCGTHFGSHIIGTHPDTTGQTITMKVCFLLDCHGEKEHDIDVTNCGGYYVYNLKGMTGCSWRYCTQGGFFVYP